MSDIPKLVSIRVRGEALPVLRQVAENFGRAQAALDEARRLLSTLTEAPERFLEIREELGDLSEGVVPQDEGKPAA